MGIVVTIAMLLGLVVLIPLTKGVFKSHQVIFIGRFLLLAGLWNALWFGLRHLGVFWGLAAIVSGLAMVMAAVLMIKQNQDPLFSRSQIVSGAYKVLKPFKPVIIALVIASFGLYAITLIRLNLGLAIIQ